MLKQQRQQKILQLLEENDTMQTTMLADALDCSTMTIRRDIDEMAEQYLVRKMHGGAIINKQDVVQPSFNRRIVENAIEKETIGKAAAKFIKNDTSVFFDAGTTPLYVAKAVPANIAFTAITNNLMTAAELALKPNVTVIMLGGEIHHSSFSTVNAMAIDGANTFQTDMAIISTKAVDVMTGLYETLLPMIELKKTIVKRAKKVLLVADHSKFTEHAMCMSIAIEDIDTIITDDKIDKKVLNSLLSRKKEVLVV